MFSSSNDLCRNHAKVGCIKAGAGAGIPLSDFCNFWVTQISSIPVINQWAMQWRQPVWHRVSASYIRWWHCLWCFLKNRVRLPSTTNCANSPRKSEKVMGCTRGQTSIHAYDQISSHMHGGNIINEKIVMMVLIEAWESCITRKRARVNRGVTPPWKASSVDTTWLTAASLAATSSDIQRVCVEVILLVTSITERVAI